MIHPASSHFGGSFSSASSIVGTAAVLDRQREDEDEDQQRDRAADDAQEDEERVDVARDARGLLRPQREIGEHHRGARSRRIMTKMKPASPTTVARPPARTKVIAPRLYFPVAGS